MGWGQEQGHLQDVSIHAEACSHGIFAMGHEDVWELHAFMEDGLQSRGKAGRLDIL